MGCSSSSGASKDGEQQIIEDYLSKVPLFAKLQAEQHTLLYKACEKVAFKAQERLVKQGSCGTDFFLIVSGEAGVYVEQIDGGSSRIATLKAGDYCGEVSLVKDDRLLSTVSADSKIKAFKLTREQYKSITASPFVAV